MALTLQDVDLCLRIMGVGYRIVFEPRAILLHMESISVKPQLGTSEDQERRQREHEYFFRRHPREKLGNDRYLNPRHHVSDETLRTLRA
jgi:GT2 family glycosyltransferase